MPVAGENVLGAESANSKRSGNELGIPDLLGLLRNVCGRMVFKMTKEDVFKFLNTATPEVYAEIRAHMVKIRQDREFAKYLENLQRSNEQLVKLIAIHHKKDKNDSLSKSEIDNLYDTINGNDD